MIRPAPLATRRRVAFYAPMKPPDDPVPSGDREIARLSLRALERAGAVATVVSRLRTRDGAGDPVRQASIRAEAEAEAARLAADLRADPPDAWYSYHSYYKAPDLLGPAVARALGIPYAIAEPSVSQRRLSGGWAGFAVANNRALAFADRLFWTTERDRPALEAAGHAARMVHLPAFLDPGPDPGAPRTAGRPAQLLTVAMMRPGDKLESYRRLAAALPALARDWRLTVVGDGSEAAAVRALFAPLGARVVLTGSESDPARLHRLYRAADCFVWPGVGEGVGLVWLEAQAAGCPAVAEDGPAARAAIEPSGLATPDDPQALAARITERLDDRPAAAARARARILARHSLDAAAAVLAAWLDTLPARAAT